MQEALGLEATSPLKLPKVEYDLPERSSWNGLILVGEAPGKDEVRLGHPFVGRSGQLLNERLAAAGIERSRTVIANVFRFQPPANKVGHFFLSRRAAAQQHLELAEEYGSFGGAWCLRDFAGEIEHLRAMLQEWQPRIIMALGRTPFWALTGESSLLEKVGQRFDCRLASGLTVIPTYHPSFILRGNWKLMDAWQEHFAIAEGAIDPSL